MHGKKAGRGGVDRRLWALRNLWCFAGHGVDCARFRELDCKLREKTGGCFPDWLTTPAPFDCPGPRALPQRRMHAGFIIENVASECSSARGLSENGAGPRLRCPPHERGWFRFEVSRPCDKVKSQGRGTEPLWRMRYGVHCIRDRMTCEQRRR